MQMKIRPGRINVGGDHFFGDIRKVKRNSKRIFFQNLGGFPTEQTKLRTALEEVRQFGADFIGIQETKINHTKRDKVREVQQQIYGTLGATSVFGSNRDGYTESYWKPGGMATLLMGTFRSKKMLHGPIQPLPYKEPG